MCFGYAFMPEESVVAFLSLLNGDLPPGLRLKLLKRSYAVAETSLLSVRCPASFSGKFSEGKASVTILPPALVFGRRGRQTQKARCRSVQKSTLIGRSNIQGIRQTAIHPISSSFSTKRSDLILPALVHPTCVCVGDQPRVTSQY